MDRHDFQQSNMFGVRMRMNEDDGWDSGMNGGLAITDVVGMSGRQLAYTNTHASGNGSGVRSGGGGGSGYGSPNLTEEQQMQLEMMCTIQRLHMVVCLTFGLCLVQTMLSFSRSSLL